MARIRSIKPEFWTDEKLTECSLSARLLFIGMLNFSDDNGNQAYSAKRLKMQIFPADSIDTQPLLDELITHGVVIEYSVNNEKYLHIKGFKVHQVINRPSATRIPEPIVNDYSVSTHGVITDGREGKGREGKGKEEPNLQHGKPCLSEKPKAAIAGFAEVWAAYPRKKNRGDAEKAWLKAKPDPALQAVILESLQAASKSLDWLRDGGQFIPYPASWLNAKGWHDQITASEYTEAQLEVIAAYNAVLADAGWPEASPSPFSQDRQNLIADFLTLSGKPGWIEAYFGWMRDKLPVKNGYGLDWVIKRDIFIRAKEGNFSMLEAV
jgi:hypothetical protein